MLFCAALVLFLSTAGLPPGGAQAPDAPTPVLLPSAGARRIVAECDRLVVARVGAVVEFVPKSGSRRPGEPAQIRIAELVSEEAWFGHLEERLFVRLAAGFEIPTDPLVWGLERDVGVDIDEWRPKSRRDHAAAPRELWIRRASLGSPWSRRASMGKQEIALPSNIASAFLDPAAPPSYVQARTPRTWVDLARVKIAIATEVAAIAPRVESCVVSTGMGGGRRVIVDRNGRGSVDGEREFRLSEDQHARWLAALDRARIWTLPSSVGRSESPCSSVQLLEFVTREGRREVRCSGGLPADGTPAAREELDRFQELWSVLDGLLPRDR